jgi:hypothetical protein
MIRDIGSIVTDEGRNLCNVDEQMVCSEQQWNVALSARGLADHSDRAV